MRRRASMEWMGRKRLVASCALAVAACALASGCATTVVVPPAPICKPPEVLTQLCTPPLEIPATSSYGDLLKTYQEERRNLAICSQRQRDLARLLEDCKSELTRYNERIQDERGNAKKAPP